MPQVQMAEFDIEGEPISVTARDAERVVKTLREPVSTWTNAADKIERATGLGQPATVKLTVGEDERVLEALIELRLSGDFGRALVRLERALQAKIARES